MIEITERVALALEVADAIWAHEYPDKPHLWLGWLRGISNPQIVDNLVQVDFNFWVNHDPTNRRKVKIWLGPTQVKDLAPISAVEVRVPDGSLVEVVEMSFTFDQNGVPTRKE